MTMCWVYVGDLEDPGFKWEGGDWNGNVPRPISPDFPAEKEHYHRIYREWVAKSGVECRATDWGTKVAKVKKQHILDYLAFCYGTDPTYTDNGLPHLVGQLRLIERLVGELDGERVYGLVASEF